MDARQNDDRRHFIANRRVAGLRFASDLSGFFAMVEVRLAGRYKLFLRLGIGDGTFPKSAKMRQKAPFRLCDSRSVTLRRSATFGCPRTHPNTELPTGISSGCVHRSVPETKSAKPGHRIRAVGVDKGELASKSIALAAGMLPLE